MTDSLAPNVDVEKGLGLSRDLSPNASERTAQEPPSPTDQVVIDRLREHGILGTWLLAMYLKVDTSAARSRLRRMERQGTIIRDRLRTTQNSIVWRLPPVTPPLEGVRYQTDEEG